MTGIASFLSIMAGSVSSTRSMGGYELWYGKKRCQVEKAEDVFRVPLFDGRALEEITGEIRYYGSGDEI